MAGNKVNTKTKNKDDKSKTFKSFCSEDNEDFDYALLRKPVQTTVTGLAQARKIFDVATEELKALLSNECDILYECKVCHNIFRSLVNFISHKRVYCQQTFDTTILGHLSRRTSVQNEIAKINHIEEEYQEFMKRKKEHSEVEFEEPDVRIPFTKDLTEVVERLAQRQHELYDDSGDRRIVLENIPNSSVAVFQSIQNGLDSCTASIGNQVQDLENVLAKDKAVLDRDGKFTTKSTFDSKSSSFNEINIIQISDDEDNNDCDKNVPKCKICDLSFSTQKTLRFHMKSKHHPSRIVYPCPDCLDLFSTSWSVYRHLFKVHRKTAAQIRKLRESITMKSFRLNNPPAFYEKRKNNNKPMTSENLTEEEKLDRENQAWMDNMECEGEGARCGGCGRTFERRAALAAHANTCGQRARALAKRDNRRREARPTCVDAQEKKPSSTEVSPTKIIEEDKSVETSIKKEESSNDSDYSASIEPKQKTNQIMIAKQNSNLPTSVKEEPTNPLNTILHHANDIPQKSNLKAFEQKISPDVDIHNLLCKRCDMNMKSIEELYSHMAVHLNWMRYSCKLCNNKNYEFEKLIEHIKVVHKLKGNTEFYSSTVKALDGPEALELYENSMDVNDSETSPDSRRPSRCSSDSSRLSDDSVSNRVEPDKKKRKACRNPIKEKRIKTDPDDNKKNPLSLDKVLSSIIGGNDFTTNAKVIDENSSDIDENDDKTKNTHTKISPLVSGRRPVRKRPKRKNEDFEYDLSNILKMEAQGYRDSQLQTYVIKPNIKKKLSTESIVTQENIEKDFYGALITLSKRAVENSIAHMRFLNFYVSNKKNESRPNTFVKPVLSKVGREKPVLNKDDSEGSDEKGNKETEQNTLKEKPECNEPSVKLETKDCANFTKVNLGDIVKPNFNIKPCVPIKLNSQSVEVLKNPLVNKNIKELAKAGMKTKILVIKPISNGTSAGKISHKLPTIRIKDPTRRKIEDLNVHTSISSLTQTSSSNNPVNVNKEATFIKLSELIKKEIETDKMEEVTTESESNGAISKSVTNNQHNPLSNELETNSSNTNT